MKFVTLKQITPVVLPPYTLELEYRDNSVHAVTILDLGRPVLKVGTEYGSLKVMVPAPPKEEQRFALFGKYMGLIEVKEEHESQLDAEQRLSEYAKRAGYPDSDTLGLKIEPVTILVPE